VFTKRKGHPPDLSEPVILSTQRRGVTVEAATGHISKEMREVRTVLCCNETVPVAQTGTG
jgi:ribosome-interacting GTPase 1